MRVLQLLLLPDQDPAAVIIRMKNLSSTCVTVVVPDPYLSIRILGSDRTPNPCVRAVTWRNSKKSVEIQPNEEFDATINLEDYWPGICGEVIVVVSLEALDERGVSQEQTVEGIVLLKTRSVDERFAELRKSPRNREAPPAPFDVSNSTQFRRVGSA